MKVYRDSLLKMVHNPGGDWHPGWEVVPIYRDYFINHSKDPYEPTRISWNEVSSNFFFSEKKTAGFLKSMGINYPTRPPSKLPPIRNIMGILAGPPPKATFPPRNSRPY